MTFEILTESNLFVQSLPGYLIHLFIQFVFNLFCHTCLSVSAFEFFKSQAYVIVILSSHFYFWHPLSLFFRHHGLLHWRLTFPLTFSQLDHLTKLLLGKKKEKRLLGMPIAFSYLERTKGRVKICRIFLGNIRR